jgi:hypothetical protein
MAVAKTVRSITGLQTTAGAAEETVSLVVDGAAPAASVTVASGTNVVISDIIAGGDALTIWKVQQTDDGGSNWFDIALVESTARDLAPSPIFDYNVGLVIQGGDDSSTAFRVRAETPGGAAEVRFTIRSYVEQ